jgi:serine/threonine protein kinase
MERTSAGIPLGRGAQGTVFSKNDTETGELVAVKQIELATVAANAARVAQEIKHLDALRHANIVRIRKYYLNRQEQCLCLEMECATRGTLLDIAMSARGAITEELAR